MLAVEAVKIIWANLLEEKPLEPIDVYVISYHKLDELIRNLRSTWFQDYNLKMIGSFQDFLKEFLNKSSLDPDEKQILEKHLHYPYDPKELLTTVAKHLQNSGKTSIIMIDEIYIQIFDEYHNEKKTSDGTPLFDLDFSYLSEYTKVHFIINLCPSIFDTSSNNFQVQLLHQEKNQYAHLFSQRHRNAEEIKKFLDFLQAEFLGRTGYCKIEDNEYVGKESLPHTFENCPGVIWVPVNNDQQALDTVENTLKDLYKNNNEPSIAILYDREKELAEKLIERNEKWSGPHDEHNFNGAEADVVVFFTGYDQNEGRLQACARARRLLIIVTHEEESDDELQGPELPTTNEWIFPLSKAVAKGLVEIISPIPLVAHGLIGLMGKRISHDFKIIRK